MSPDQARPAGERAGPSGWRLLGGCALALVLGLVGLFVAFLIWQEHHDWSDWGGGGRQPPPPLESVLAEDVLAKTEPVMDELLAQASRLPGVRITQTSPAASRGGCVSTVSRLGHYSLATYDIGPVDWQTLRDLVRQVTAGDPAWDQSDCDPAEDGTATQCNVYWSDATGAQARIRVLANETWPTSWEPLPPQTRTVYLELQGCFPTNKTDWFDPSAPPFTPVPWTPSPTAPAAPSPSGGPS